VPAHAEAGLAPLPLGGPPAALGGADVAHRALDGAERHADLPPELGQLAARVADLLRQRDERLARHPELAVCALQRGPLVRRELTALGSVREAVRQAEQLGRQAAGALLDRLEAAPERRGPLEGSVEPAGHLLGLPAREPEPAERGEEARLEARATLGEPGAPAASMGERARERVALHGEPPHPPELSQEVPPQAHVLVP